MSEIHNVKPDIADEDWLRPVISGGDGRSFWQKPLKDQVASCPRCQALVLDGDRKYHLMWHDRLAVGLS